MLFRQRQVQPAFAGLPEDPAVTRIHVCRGRNGGVVVANRPVALLEHRVVGEVVLFHVALDVLGAPVKDRVKLDAAVLSIDPTQSRTVRGLLGTEPGHPGACVELVQSALHRLDLVDLEIALHAFFALLPEPSVKRLLARGGHLRRVELHVQLQPLHKRLGELIRLGEEVARVDADDRGAGRDTMDQVKHHRRRGAEARRGDQGVAELRNRPLDELLRARRFQRSVLVFEVGINRRDAGDFHGLLE